MLLEEITMKDFADGLKKTKTLILPLGTVEEHGSHLPLSLAEFSYHSRGDGILVYTE